ncbi:uncharacterized protein LOC108043692 isoform X2 [Drosophila rhopaloa]|uniref:Uncharacterized protein LOC108043692 isoform X2 n=1 Tax=Drosophila rhopaloa TaxID=1041015 RepID=A0A6P4EN10_DRORH|nr:uncharacterized protein LOC108043692 isoform X2 [Drosophila rhopaloa]
MFVKVKLDSDENSSVKPQMFEIEQTANVLDLKMKLEALVGLPLSRLEIQNLSRNLANDENLSELLRVKEPRDSIMKINGSAFSLLNGKAFLAFLQFYNRSEGDSQLSFLNRPSDSMLLPVDRLPQFCEVSDSQDSTISSISDKTNTSFESASTSASSAGRKRKARLSDEESVAKRIRSSPSPNVVKVVAQNVLSNNQDGKISTFINSKAMIYAKSCKKEPSVTTEDFDYEEEPNPHCKDKRDCCTQNKCGMPDNRPPYAKTMPENRRYGLVISNDDKDAEGVDQEALMRQFFKLFENCGVHNLHFSSCTSVAKFCVNLLVVCEDDETADWVISAVEGVCPPHTCLPFIKFFRLIRCTFVLPLIVPGKPLCSIFDLLEMQNCGIVTHKWTVIGRTILDPCQEDFNEMAVSSLCDNELIELYIDEDSKEIIENQCYKLKYCFWRLKFDFEC